ncbi:hypothetical protein OPQ81_001706 [Rhizoctonia solani]|nr:hypothetical protein OPQ81_001706 [Rhizoctonia solani]
MICATAVLLALTAIAGAAPTHRHDEDPSSELLAARAAPQDYLTPHNNERARHGARALVWDNALASSAQAWANQCQFRHSQSGQNLYAGSGNPTAAAAIAWWNAESNNYNPRNPQPSHWTQVVWKGTTKLGCGMKQCPPGTVLDAKYVANYYVCHYSPAGNIRGQFPQNVQK